eukprot:1140844-Pelagomonas_calceolata.AAC.4
MACRQGKLKAIGVSNYEESHLKELASQAKIMPMVNQGDEVFSALILALMSNTRHSCRHSCTVVCLSGLSITQRGGATHSVLSVAQCKMTSTHLLPTSSFSIYNVPLSSSCLLCR